MHRLAAGPVLLLALLAVAPSPGACASALASSTPGDPTAPLLAALSLLAWAGTGWLSAVTALLVVLHGRTGRAARALRRLAPQVLRRSVAAALGATLVLGTGGTATAAEPPAPVSAQLAPAQFDWPTDEAPAPAVARPRPAPAAAVVVAPGDSLWSLAAGALGPAASARAVAREWPAWWQANRAVIGEDPDLLRPGTRLVPPTR